jgi:hypothetical protein
MAKHQIALSFYNKEKSMADPQKFKENIIAAADKGFSPSQYVAAFYYYSGMWGFSKDEKRSRYYAELSAAQGFEAAKIFLKKIGQ